MEIVIRGGMYDRKRSEVEEVFYFGQEIQFLWDFDPRDLNIGEAKQRNVDGYSYIIRTTEDGFDYGIQFLNEHHGPRNASIVIFLRAGWCIPGNGDALLCVLKNMAQKTYSAIGKYVDGYDDEYAYREFQNPLADIDFNEIIKNCDFTIVR